MTLDRFREGPDDPQDTVQRWVGEVTLSRTIRIGVDDDCYSESDAREIAIDRVCDTCDWKAEMDGQLTDAREL